MTGAETVAATTFPLIIGVTGHRDLCEHHVALLETALAREVARVRERYPHSSLVLLSPLAEGADRAAARVALKAGVRLIAPLPLPLELYEADPNDRNLLEIVRAERASFVNPV